MNAAPTSHARHLPLLERAMHSFLALLVGVAAGAALCLLVMGLESGESLFGFAFAISFAFIALTFATPIWLVAMLPLSLVARSDNELCGAWSAPLFGTAMGLVAMLLWLGLVLATFSIGATEFAVAVGGAAVVGATAWGSFAWWLRRAPTAEHSHPFVGNVLG